jgi:hypothetical protein
LLAERMPGVDTCRTAVSTEPDCEPVVATSAYPVERGDGNLGTASDDGYASCACTGGLCAVFDAHAGRAQLDAEGAGSGDPRPYDDDDADEDEDEDCRSA